MARSPLAPGPADEDVTHGQDVSPEDVEDEAYGDEEEEILDDGSGCRLLSRSLDTSAHASPRGARLTHGSLCHSAAVEADSFEAMVATLEEVMMDEGFNEKVGAFMQEHCHEFDEGEENKLVYTQLFADYTTMLETYIAEHISTRLPGFDMPAFCKVLRERAEELPMTHLDLDTLGAFGDFEAFKARRRTPHPAWEAPLSRVPLSAA